MFGNVDVILSWNKFPKHVPGLISVAIIVYETKKAGTESLLFLPDASTSSGLNVLQPADTKVALIAWL